MMNRRKLVIGVQAVIAAWLLAVGAAWAGVGDGYTPAPGVPATGGTIANATISNSVVGATTASMFSPAATIAGPTIRGTPAYTQFAYSPFSAEMLSENALPFLNSMVAQNDDQQGYSAYVTSQTDTMYPTNQGVSVVCATTAASLVISCAPNSVPNGSLITGTGAPAVRPFANVKSGGGTTSMTMTYAAASTQGSTTLVFSPPMQKLTFGCQDNGNPSCYIESARYDRASNPLVIPMDFRFFLTGGIDATGGTPRTCSFTAGSTAFTCTSNLPANGTQVFDGSLYFQAVYGGAYSVKNNTTLVSGAGTTAGVLSSPAVQTLANDLTYFLNNTWGQKTIVDFEPVRYDYFLNNAGSSSILTLDRGGAGQVIVPAGTPMIIGPGAAQTNAALTVIGNAAVGTGLTNADANIGGLSVGNNTSGYQILVDRYVSGSSVAKYALTANTAGTVFPSGANPEMGIQSQMSGNPFGLAIDLTTGVLLAPNGFKRPIETVATLPTCNPAYQAVMFFVTDAASPVSLAVVSGSGSTPVGVTCNGTNWIVQ